MQIFIGFRTTCRKRASSIYDIGAAPLTVDKQNFSTRETSIQISPFSLMLLIAGITNYKIQFVLTLCAVLLALLIISYVYTYHWCSIKDKIHRLRDYVSEMTQRKVQALLGHMYRWYTAIGKVECEFLKLIPVSSTVNQLVFFVICERVLVPQQNVTALYSLMFYNIIGYCVIYVQQLLGTHKYTLYVNVATHSNVRHLAMTATKMVLEWTKALTFVVTVGFLLFVLCLEYRLNYFQPTKFYTLCTWIYYISTEKIFTEFFPVLLTMLHFSKFEDLESLWAPVLLSLLTETLSLIFACTLLVYGAYQGAIVSLYINVYLSHKQLANDSLKVLNRERNVILQFRSATKSELKNFEDICAVCLADMKSARVTPCQHLFHADCLRRCLQTSNFCPLCKREFVFYQNNTSTTPTLTTNND